MNTERTQKLNIYERLHLAAQHLEMAKKMIDEHCSGHKEESYQIDLLRISVTNLKKQFSK